MVRLFGGSRESTMNIQYCYIGCSQRMIKLGPLRIHRWQRLLMLISIYLLAQLGTYYNVRVFGTAWAPVYLLIITSTLPILLIRQSARGVETRAQPVSSNQAILSVVLLLAITAVGCMLMRQAFAANPLPTANSDVITQIEHLYDRFLQGLQPYTTVESYAWKPFPVYMPMHWLPIGIGRTLGIDIRWSGFIIFCMSGSYVVYRLLSKKQLGATAALLLPLVIFLFYQVPLAVRPGEMSDVTEITVAAYYLLLGLALYQRSDHIIILSLICIMLSRYTIVFWLPLLAYTLYMTSRWRKLLPYVGFGALGFLLLYVLPFWIREPDILMDGIGYHNKVAEVWYGDMVKGRTVWVLFQGSSSMQLFYLLTDIADPVRATKYIRLLQLALLTTTIASLVVVYHKNRSRVISYDYLLAAAALILAVFFCTAPFGYGYYWFAYHMLMIFVLLRLLQPIQSDSRTP